MVSDCTEFIRWELDQLASFTGDFQEKYLDAIDKIVYSEIGPIH